MKQVKFLINSKAILSLILVASFLFLTPRSLLAQSSAVLSLSPASGSFAATTSFDVSVLVNTNGARVDGVDARLTFDPEALEILSLSESTLFPTYPAKSFDNSRGTIAVSGLSSVANPVSTTTPTSLFSFRLKPRRAGAASVNFIFQAGSTTDSNVVENGTNLDILTSVNNANFTIVSGPEAQIPRAGVAEISLLMLGFGGLLILAGSLWRLKLALIRG